MLDTQETDVASTVESTASSESSSASETPVAAQAQEAPASVEKPTPFHEHPRFKEIIEQNRQYREQQDNYSRQVQEMQKQMADLQKAHQTSQKPQKPSYDPVLERLKGIDPEFGSLQNHVVQQIAAIPELQETIQQMNQWRAEMESQRTKQEASAAMDRLFTQFKVGKEDREDYEYRIKAMAYENPNLTVKDLDGVFKQTHEALSKRSEERRRKERESYVQDKTKDKVPTTQTGGAPAHIPGPSKSTPEERSALIAQALRAAKNQ